MKFIFNSFVRRQVANSRFGHTTLSDAEVLTLVRDNFHKARKGYRPGVCLVPVPPEGWFTGTVPLKVGMSLKATYEPRKEGEKPRMHIGLAPPVKTWPDGHISYDYEGAKAPAVAVDVVLYSSLVLAEDGDNELEAEEGNWEILSLNPRLSVEDEPIPPGTLMANHFHEDGGTATGMTDAEFVAALRVSRAYWNGKVSLG